MKKIKAETAIVDYPIRVETLWKARPPACCPYEDSENFCGVLFTGKYATYTNADTWYPSWASNGNLYSPWTDGMFGDMRIWSGEGDAEAVCMNESDSGEICSATGHAEIIGDNPLDLEVVNLGYQKASPRPYKGRYPCASLIYDGIWYYGTYAVHTKVNIWDQMGPFVGFRISKDYGRTWDEPSKDVYHPLFGEHSLNEGEKVKFGSPHFVDFGQNMEHSPDGKAYLIGHGGSNPDADVSWVTGDEIYICRVLPSLETINDKSAYEFFAGYDENGEAIWSNEFDDSRPLLKWKNMCGVVTVTYNEPLNKFLMCVTSGGIQGGSRGEYNSYILESKNLTGPWKIISFMSSFGPQGYFLNLPSKFISDDGKTLWLSYSTNWSQKDTPGNPAGGGYAFTLKEIKLLDCKEIKEYKEKPIPPDPVKSPNNLALLSKVEVSSVRGNNRGEAAVDGLIAAYGVPTLTEWVSTESAGAWIKLFWASEVELEEVWIFSRKWDSQTVIKRGKLTFSDGTEIEVDAVPRAGRRHGLSVKFPRKKVSWLKFTVEEVEGQNIGLSEIATFAEAINLT